MTTLAKRARAFVDYVEDWMASLKPLKLSKAIDDPSRVAVICVDIINGFCTIGPLASPRVQGIVKPIAKLFKDARAAGVRPWTPAQTPAALLLQ